MITTILSIILFIIFIILACFHFYWFIGGTWGLDKVIPSKGAKANSIQIPKFATLIVGLGLTSCGLLYLIKSGLWSFAIPSWISSYAFWLIPIIFILRSIGEFNYVGFFKKVKHSDFAKADSKIFSPLCLFIGIAGIFIQLIN